MEPVTVQADKKVMAIAKVCHQANKAWCEVNGDVTQKDWKDAEPWQRESAIKGVVFAMDNHGVSAQHDAWMKDKFEAGWTYGEEKNVEKKTHPCLVPFTELPEHQQKKDVLFRAIVEALS